MQIIEVDHNFGSLSYRSKTNRIILHHAEASTCTVEQINAWHKGNGWAGIGYHFFVRKDGTVYRGRPIGAIGAHASGCNSDSIGICAEGAYMHEWMPESQRQAITDLIAYVRDRYGNLAICRHRDVGSTDCPGDNYPFDAIVTGSPCNEIHVGQSAESTESDCLGRGDRGDAVKALQERLVQLGYSCGDCGADGIFGADTEQAVKSFQADHGLKADGIAGQKTKTAMDCAEVASPIEAESTDFPLPDGHWYGTPSSDDRNHSGYYDTADRPGIARIQAYLGIDSDGLYGKYTEAAVTEYQRNHDLAADGLAGARTWASMF